MDQGDFKRPPLGPKNWKPADGVPRRRYSFFFALPALAFLLLAIFVEGRGEVIYVAFCIAFFVMVLIAAFAPSNMWAYSPDYIPLEDRQGRVWGFVKKLSR